MAGVNKFRASFTILSTWESGNWERAIKQYFKLEEFRTRAMDEGKKLHEDWQVYIDKNKTLPAIFDPAQKPLVKPLAEFKRVVSLRDWLDLVGVIDCVDSPTIYEFKSGKTNSEVYAGSRQVGVYGVLATYSGIYVDRAEIYHYDQYNRSTDMSIVYITDELLRNSLNWIESVSCEIHDYFIKNDLYSRLDHKMLLDKDNTNILL
jgi:hypothetical protein